MFKSGQRALNGTADLIDRNMRILADQAAFDVGNQQLFADLRHW